MLESLHKRVMYHKCHSIRQWWSVFVLLRASCVLKLGSICEKAVHWFPNDSPICLPNWKNLLISFLFSVLQLLLDTNPPSKVQLLALLLKRKTQKTAKQQERKGGKRQIESRGRESAADLAPMGRKCGVMLKECWRWGGDCWRDCPIFHSHNQSQLSVMKAGRDERRKRRRKDRNRGSLGFPSAEGREKAVSDFQEPHLLPFK